MDEDLKKVFDEYPEIASLFSLYVGIRLMRIVIDVLAQEVQENEV